MPAFKVDLEAACRLADRERIVQAERMAGQRPVVVLHEEVGIGQHQFPLHDGREGRQGEALPARGGREAVHLRLAERRRGLREARAFRRRQRRGDGLLRRVAWPAGDFDLHRAAARRARHGAFGERLREGRKPRLRRGDLVAEHGRRPLAEGEEPAAFVQVRLRPFDMRFRLVLLEAHGDQLVRQRQRRCAEAGFTDEGVGLVQGGVRAPLGVGHPQHPAEQLLHVGGAADVRDGAEDVGEGAIPPLLQRLDGDDVLDGAGRVEQVDAVELALRAGGDGDLLFRDPLRLHQVPLQRLGRDLAVLRLRLEQRDGADVAAVPLRLLRQLGAGGDGGAHGALPDVVFGQGDGQLDHLRALQFLGRGAVQDVGVQPRRRREFDHRAGVHPRLHLPRQPGDGVVRLVHDHQRAVAVQQVGEGVFHAAVFAPLQPRRAGVRPGEMRLHVLVVGVHLAAFGALHPQGLDGADDDAAGVAQVLRAEAGEVRDVEHPRPSGEGVVEGPPVGVVRILQRLRRLPADGVGRREPEDERMVLLDPGVAGHGDGVGGEDGFAAAGGQAEAGIGRARQSFEGRVIPGVAPEPRRLFRLPHEPFVGRRRPGKSRLFEEAPQHRQRLLLVGFEFHVRRPLSARPFRGARPRRRGSA